MAVSLYTVKLVLNCLGVVDYGIYNVVGGVVAMLSFLSSSMTGSSQRFFSFDLGRKDYKKLRKTFSATFYIYVIIALISVAIAETIGLWFLENKMVIPNDRINASFWVFQLSILSFVIGIISIPYQSVIIAREKIRIYTYIGFIEAFLKIVVVYLLYNISYDKLVLYSILMLLSILITNSIFFIYSRISFNETKLILYFEKKIFSEITSYASWNVLGAFSNILRTNGLNILINLFFGPLVNAAMAIANQINGAINNLVINFYLAVRPQITKAFASNNYNYFLDLIYTSSKFSYYIVLIITMPLIIETDFVINMWLNQPPDYSVIFVRLLLIGLILETVNNQLVSALQATGNIKIYQIVISSISMAVLPVSFLFFKLGAAPEYAFYIYIGLIIFNFIPQLIIVKKIINLSLLAYFKKVLFPVISVTIVSFSLNLYIYNSLNYGIHRFIIILTIGLIINFISIYFVGISANERSIAKHYIGKIISN